MRILTDEKLPNEQIDELATFATTLPHRQMRGLLEGLVEQLRDGDEILALSPNSDLSPQAAAQQLGMSRTHLYKLLDRGAIPSHRVGRDRRIKAGDLIKFQEERLSSQKELAERFARQTETRKGAARELVELM